MQSLAAPDGSPRVPGAAEKAVAPLLRGGGRAASPVAITLAWLVRLRWGAVIGQAVTILTSELVLRLGLPILPLGILVTVTALSNAALALWLRRATEVSDAAAVIVLAADTLMLTGLLYFSGGPANPFSILYLVYVTVAALVLGLRWALATVVLSAASYAVLFFRHQRIVALEHAHHGGSAFSIHLQGMWVAFTIAATLIAYFVSRVASALREREAELARVQQVAARAEKLASLTTLAAGAAHELGTPLGTIAVASKEIERAIRSSPDEALEDARLIRSEVERCHAIVQRMGARAGETVGELPERTTSSAIVARCVERSGAKSARVKAGAVEDVSFVCPVEGLVQVLLNLVQNGVDASTEDVLLAADATPAAVRFHVVDRGSGMSVANLARIGEPFFTTKAPGSGMGLGVFLAYAFADRCGGKLAYSSEEGQGTRVALELPRSHTEGATHG